MVITFVHVCKSIMICLNERNRKGKKRSGKYHFYLDTINSMVSSTSQRMLLCWPRPNPPNAWRVVSFGQSPYPRMESATGIAHFDNAL